jgi:transcriptional regulator with XRE-family HTH domain
MELSTALRQARQAAGMSLATMAARTHYSKPYLSLVETGNRAATPSIVSAYEETLGTRISGLSRVGLADVTLISQATDVLTALGLRHGGPIVVNMARAQWAIAARLLDDAMTDEVRGRLFAQAGRLADRAAWALSEAGRHRDAVGMYRTALELANVDPDLETMVLTDQASHLISRGQPAEALALLADLPSSAPVLRFSAEGARALAYAVLGDRESTLRSIGKSDTAWSDVDLGNIPEYHRPYVSGHQAHAHNAAGKALYVLAQRGHQRVKPVATERLREAIAAFGPDRARALSRCEERLATL